MARSPRGKARVCKTLTAGSSPALASTTREPSEILPRSGRPDLGLGASGISGGYELVHTADRVESDELRDPTQHPRGGRPLGPHARGPRPSSSAVERLPHMQEVGGSTPSSGTNTGRQLRAAADHDGDRFARREARHTKVEPASLGQIPL